MVFFLIFLTYFFCMFTYLLMVFSGDLVAFNYNYYFNNLGIQKIAQEIEKIKQISLLINPQQHAHVIVGFPFVYPLTNFDILSDAIKYPELIMWLLNILTIIVWVAVLTLIYNGYKSYLEHKRENLI